jgi:hypothetical protein
MRRDGATWRPFLSILEPIHPAGDGPVVAAAQTGMVAAAFGGAIGEALASPVGGGAALFRKTWAIPPFPDGVRVTIATAATTWPA